MSTQDVQNSVEDVEKQASNGGMGLITISFSKKLGKFRRRDQPGGPGHRARQRFRARFRRAPQLETEICRIWAISR